MAEIIGQEAKALGVSQLFAPVVDLARELRYGRVSWIVCRSPRYMTD
jgi:beta-glucosidase